MTEMLESELEVINLYCNEQTGLALLMTGKFWKIFEHESVPPHKTKAHDLPPLTPPIFGLLFIQKFRAPVPAA
jgi:hypothetical protein